MSATSWTYTKTDTEKHEATCDDENSGDTQLYYTSGPREKYGSAQMASRKNLFGIMGAWSYFADKLATQGSFKSTAEGSHKCIHFSRKKSLRNQ